MATEVRETILIFAANPQGQSKLALDREVREIENGLRHSRKHFDVRSIWATRSKDLRRALLDYEPDYVHFCGHGAGQSGIVMEGQFVGAEALAGLFGLFSSTIKCVVLNACFSTIQAQAIVRNIEYVVGMKKEIGDLAAIEFSTAFYDALGAGRTVDFAFKLGCNGIQLAGIPEHLTPELLTRSTVVTETQPKLESQPKHSRRDWDGAPAVSLLYGREVAAELLKSWIIDDSCRVVLITGLGGIGKTDLATCLGRGGNRSVDTSETLASGIQGQFDSVMWRSLLNAPAPEDLFSDMLTFLSEYQGSPHSLQKQLDDLLDCLQRRRCLVILDNVEAILKPGDSTTRYREGYEQYGAFFELVARTTHQSCLLLTSREKPRAIADFEGARKPVRSLTLNGIGAVESRDLFGQIGSFRGDERHWEAISKLYNGNPLALELAARHIDQVFGGDLSVFLGSGRTVFADLKELLDWHLNRLTKDETELVYWMAIEREPVTIATLSDDLISQSSRENIASTLQSLQRRIPLERMVSQHFSLQPVLIEHVTEQLVDRVVTSLTRISHQLSQLRQSERLLVHQVDADLEVFNTHALVKATVKENVRDSQQRLILAPIAQRLSTVHLHDTRVFFDSLLDVLRQDKSAAQGYAVGNIINLMSHLNVDLHGFDFSHLPIWQACLHDRELHNTDFSFARFHRTSFRHPFGTVFSVCYSPDGELIAVGDDNGEIRLILSASGQLHLRCIGHSDGIRAICFSPDGQTLASASFDNTIRLWSVNDASCIKVLLGHRGWVYSIDFSPDGKTLASASEDGTCRIWNLDDGSFVSPMTMDPEFLAAVAFSPDGHSLAIAGSGGMVSLFRLPNVENPVLLAKSTARIRALAYSPQGDLLASGAEDNTITLWDPEDGSHLGTLMGHSGSIKALSFSALGDILASASNDHTVRLWSTGRQECVGLLQVAQSRVWAVHCHPNGRTLLTGSDDGSVRVWDMDTAQSLTTLRGYSNKTWSLAFSEDPTILLAGSEDSLVRLWDVSEGREIRQLRGHQSRVWAVACSPDGKWMASASDDLTVRLWDSRSELCTRTLTGHQDWIRSVAFDHESKYLASAGEDGKVLVWSLPTCNLIASITTPMTRVFSVKFCSRGRWLAVGGTAEEIHLYSIPDWKPVGELGGYKGWLSALVAYEDSLGGCSEDGTVKLWDLKKRQCVVTLDVGNKVWCGAFSRSGEAFLTGGEDGMLRLWRLGTALCEARQQAHQGSLWSLGVNANDHAVATSGDDGSIRLWTLPDLVPCTSPNLLRPPRPYEGMNITGADGLTPAQRDALEALGAFSIPSS